MLKIKTMTDLLPKFIFDITNKTDKITDFSVGSAIRSIADSVCLQLEEFYFAMYQNVQYAIEHSIYDAFGFSIKPATAANGYVKMIFNSPLISSVVIPNRTVFTTQPTTTGVRRFYTDKSYTAPIGSTELLVHVVSEITGVESNIAFNTITSMETYFPFVQEVYNPYSITNGMDEETPKDRKTRFQRYIRTLSRGTREAILYGALEVDGVQGAYVDDSWIGYVRVYAHDPAGDLSEPLRQEIIENEVNYRAAGIEVDVWAVNKVYVNFSLYVYIGNEYDTNIYQSVIYDNIIKYINSYKVSDNFFASDIISFVRNLYPDVVVDVQSPDLVDYEMPFENIIRAGTINVECFHIKDWKDW